MSFDIAEIITDQLNGEPLHDAIACGIMFICFYEFISIFFGAIASLFK